jgi:Kef-type K+ transport system membrane component KefB
LTTCLIVFAIVSKIIGSGIGARLGGLMPSQALQVGCAMISRGEVALVIAGAGLAGGLLDATTFSTLIVVTLATTLITPPLLRLSAVQLRPISLPVSIGNGLLPARWQEFVAEE